MRRPSSRRPSRVATEVSRRRRRPRPGSDADASRRRGPRGAAGPWPPGRAPGRARPRWPARARSPSLVPPGPNSLMPLSWNGLWEAEITTAGRSRRTDSQARAGVGRTPTSTTSAPSLARPAAEGGLQHGAGAAGVATDQEGGGGDGAGHGAAQGEDQLGGELGVGDAPDAVGAEPGSGHRAYRFEYWGALRAFFRPYFLDSFSRESRVRNPAFLSGAAQLGVELAQGPGDAQAEGAGLAGHPAAVDGHVDVPRLGGLGQPEGLGDDHPVGGRGEVLLERVPVAGDGALAGAEADPGDGLLAASGGLADGGSHWWFLRSVLVRVGDRSGGWAHAPLRADAVRRAPGISIGIGGLGGVGVLLTAVDLQLGGHLAARAGSSAACPGWRRGPPRRTGRSSGRRSWWRSGRPGSRSGGRTS